MRIGVLYDSETVFAALISGGLLKPFGSDQVKFLHDSIGEFLAAEVLCDQKANTSLSQLLDQRVADQKWREPLSFFVGLLGEEELDEVAHVKN